MLSSGDRNGYQPVDDCGDYIDGGPGNSNTPLTTPQTIDLFLTTTEAAKIARIHSVAILRWAREGRVPHRRLSARKIVFPLSALTSWLESGCYSDSAVRAA